MTVNPHRLTLAEARPSGPLDDDKADVVSGLSLATGEPGEGWLASAAALPSTS